MAILKVPDDFRKIQDAINHWKVGDVIRVAQGNYQENITLVPGVILEGGFKSDFSVQNWAQWPSVIDGNQLGSVVVGAAHSEINGFTIRHGKAKNGGGIFVEHACMTIRNNTIEDNSAEYNGGGLYIAKSPSAPPYLDIHNNVIRRNTAEGHKGGYGGGIYVAASSGGIRINNNTIGGKAHDGNTASWAGGGIFVEDAPNIQIDHNEISQNTTNAHGGGVVIIGGTSNSELCKNKIHYNLAYGNYGGGVYTLGGAFVSKNSIMGNVVSNYSLGKGGGIAAHGSERASPIVENNFINGNYADYGGGIHIDHGEHVLIINNSIAHNKANPDKPAGGGVHVTPNGQCVLLNNILWDNRDDLKVEANGFCILDHNDIEDGDGNGKLGNISSDPKFVSQDDLHIKAGSPAIDAGDRHGAPQDDIDDKKRSRNPDIGADEFSGDK